MNELEELPGADTAGQFLQPLRCPIYNTGDLGRLSAPTVGTNFHLAWSLDLGAPTGTGNVRADHPRLFAPNYKWKRLPAFIAADPYLATWNKTIYERAAEYYGMPPTNYSIDGSLCYDDEGENRAYWLLCDD